MAIRDWRLEIGNLKLGVGRLDAGVAWKSAQAEACATKCKNADPEIGVPVLKP